MTRDTIGPAVGLKFCAVWYPGKPKASSSGDYLVLQKEKLQTLKTQEQKKVFLYVSSKDIYNASS